MLARAILKTALPRKVGPTYWPSLAVVVFTSIAAGCAANVTDPSLVTGSVSTSQDLALALPKREEKVVKIALVLPFGAGGPTAAIAKGMKQAGEMALFDRDDASFQLIAVDDKGTPEGAKAAVEQALKDGAELVLGPLFSASVGSAAAVARAVNIPVISFSNDRKVAGRGVYLMSYLPDEEVERVVAYAASQGKRRFAALIPDDAYGQTVAQAFQSAVTKSGSTIVGQERYPLQANGMLEPARRLVEQIKLAESEGQPVDALFLPGGQETLVQLSPVLAYAGLTKSSIRVIGTGGMDHPSLGKDPLLKDAWFAGPDPRGWQDFSARFAKTFGSAPPRIAALAYDAVTVAASLAKEPSAARYTTGNLTRSAGFQGVDGLVRLGESGLVSRSLAVLAVHDTGSTVVDAAQTLVAQPTLLSGTGGRVN